MIEARGTKGPYPRSGANDGCRSLTRYYGHKLDVGVLTALLHNEEKKTKKFPLLCRKVNYWLNESFQDFVDAVFYVISYESMTYRTSIPFQGKSIPITW